MSAFWLECVSLSLAVLFLATAAGMLLSNLVAWLLCRIANRDRLLGFPGVLFSVRVFPVAFGAIVTLGFALPSFLLFEPERSVEPPEPYLLVLAMLALAGIVVAAVRCARTFFLSRKTVREWVRNSEALPVSTSIPVYKLATPESVVAVIGIRHPKVFIGKTAVASLSADELKAAVAHELAHVRSFDNLRQLVLRITRLPRFMTSFNKLDSVWSASSELLADTNALKSGTSAVELSSAIVKVGRLRAMPLKTLAVAGCQLVPPDGSPSALAMRIQHLHEALKTPSQDPTQESHRFWFISFFAAAFAYFLLLPSALPVVHQWMEWLAK